MCYSIYLSTNSPQNLEQTFFKHLSFIGDFEPEPGHVELLPLLAHPQRWYLTRREYGGCSCHFRHSIEEASFEPPQDWFPEDEDNVAATKEAYNAFREIVADGYQLDLINVWSGDMVADRVTNLEVVLDSVPAESFRFFEGYRFSFRR